MATKNPKLENLSFDQILEVSQQVLMGWTDPMATGWGFRLKGLNRKRLLYGLEPLTKEKSVEYRIQYVQEHYSYDEIKTIIGDYLRTGRVGDERWSGIYLFGCRFGREYAGVFRRLLGSSVYRLLSESNRVEKLVETQEQRYGGVGLGGEATLAKAQATNVSRYGVSNVMQNDEIKSRIVSPFADSAVREKVSFVKWQNTQRKITEMLDRGCVCDRLLRSRFETIVFFELVSKFGREDVFYEYGIHPSDKRYPHNCDFYIRSLDLFIELNSHYSHGNHWFDVMNHDDCLRRDHMLLSDSERMRLAVKTWCDVDLKKREDAKRSGIKYLVFWDGTCHHEKGEPVPNLKDFYLWFYDYDCDYDRFVSDFPGNSY